MKFMNMRKWLYSNPQEEAGGGEGGAAGGQGSAGAGGGEPDAGKQAQPEIDYDKLAAAMVKAQSGGDQGGDQDRFKKMQDQDAKKKEEQSRIEKIQADTRFHDSFDAFVEKNKEMLGGKTAQDFKNAANGLTGDQLTNTLKALVAKAAFNNQEVEKWVDDSSKSFVEKLKNSAESAIDGGKAWDILSRTLSVVEKVGAVDIQRGLKNTKDAPSIQAYADNMKFKPKEGGGFVN